MSREVRVGDLRGGKLELLVPRRLHSGPHLQAWQIRRPPGATHLLLIDTRFIYLNSPRVRRKRPLDSQSHLRSPRAPRRSKLFLKIQPLQAEPSSSSRDGRR
jgi:hypothetical protein